MNNAFFFKTHTIRLSVLLVAVLLCFTIPANAANTKTLPPPRPAPAAKPVAPARTTAPTAKPGSNTSAPSANRPISNGGGVSKPQVPSPTPSGPLVMSTPRPNGIVVHTTRGGGEVRMRPDGRTSNVHDPKRNMDIHNGLNGGHRVIVEHPDRSQTVFQRGRPGYVQRPYSYRGHGFARRTYSYHGRAYTHIYHSYEYRGRHLNVYAPEVYYGPGYYAWAYHLWAAPVAFQWGFTAAPWYGYYGSYFAPAAMYPSASLWLTDYMISSDLQQAYAAHTEGGETAEAASGPGDAPALTPDVKQQIAEEVKNQLALENQEAQLNATRQDVNPGSSGIDRMINDGKSHVFVVGSPLDAEDALKNECALSDGDVLSLHSATLPEATTVNLLVLASKGGRECKIQATVTVIVEDLQEMQNHMRESIDKGLQELKSKQGKDGIPAAPASAQLPPAQSMYAAIAPPEDSNASAEIAQQAQQADQAEKEITTETVRAAN